jgi:prepilin-type N-terminal cleavage/methylation domain-containing protein/prepilin-type processing-associated H-X9-DG protein
MKIINKKYHRFTLVELLVVIAIISILAGMLLPALENALDASRAIVCANNLKQMGTAVNMYIGDADGNIPCSYDCNATPSNWDDDLELGHLLYPYIGVDSGTPINEVALFGCSSPESYLDSGDGGYTGTLTDVQSSSYETRPSYNTNANLLINNRLNPTYSNIKSSIQKSPSQTMILLDGYRNALGENPFYSGIQGFPTLRERANWECHREGANVLFLDNHFSYKEGLDPYNDAPWSPRWSEWLGEGGPYNP